MTGLEATGFRTDLGRLRGAWRAVLAVHGVKTLLALPAAALVGQLVHQELAHSLEAGRFAEALQPALLVELLRAVKPALGAGLWALVALLPLAALILSFVDGALLRILRPAEGPPGALLIEGGRAFPGLLSLLPFAFVVTVAFGLLPGFGLHRLGLWLSEDMRDEVQVFLLRFALFAGSALIFVHTRAACGLARARAAAGLGLRAALRLMLRALADPRLATLPSLPWYLLIGLGVLGLSLMDVRLGRSSAGLIALGMAVQQLSGLLRTFFGAGILAGFARTESRL